MLLLLFSNTSSQAGPSVTTVIECYDGFINQLECVNGNMTIIDNANGTLPFVMEVNGYV